MDTQVLFTTGTNSRNNVYNPPFFSFFTVLYSTVGHNKKFFLKKSKIKKKKKKGGDAVYASIGVGVTHSGL